MNKPKVTKVLLLILLSLAVFSSAYAGDVKILGADFLKTGNNSWSLDVTLKHGDTGWDHYADKWRVVDAENNILGERVLYHPHVNEQPFTRGLNDVKIPEDTRTVYIEAHDKVHGWTPDRLKADLTGSEDERFRIEAQ